MPQTRCKQCGHRLPYAAFRCNRCGWEKHAVLDQGRARSRAARRRQLLAVVGILIAMGGGAAYMNAPVLADWYAGFAARYLPGPMSSFAPVDTDQGAFFFCARQVSRELDGDFSVETFPPPAEGQAETLADGRYRIVSWVDEAREDGGRVRHGFECTVSHEGGRWALDDLQLAQYAADGSPPEFTRAN